MRTLPLLFAVILPAALVLAAADKPQDTGPPSPAEIVASAPADAWRPIAPETLAVMTLGNERQVYLELAPQFAPAHVGNIVKLAKAGWFAGTSINRLQDNYVVQWGDATEKKPLPDNVAPHPMADYERPLAGLTVQPLATTDPYAPAVGFADGWPVGADPKTGKAWLAHCYGMVGVGRDYPPDTGTGAELYVVIGHAPRQLDRNIALVGRVVGGIEALTALPRGTGDLGFYKTPAERVAIRSITLASDMPAETRPKFEVMRTDTPLFGRYLDARANRRDRFYLTPAGGVDLCNVPIPTRRAP